MLETPPNDYRYPPRGLSALVAASRIRRGQDVSVSRVLVCVCCVFSDEVAVGERDLPEVAVGDCDLQARPPLQIV